MANPEQAGEPSMEEILASIRKIISDEDEVPEGEQGSKEAEAEDTGSFDEADHDRAFEAAESEVFAEEGSESSDESAAAGDETPAGEDADVFETEVDTDVLELSEDTIVAETPSPLPLTEPAEDDITFVGEEDENEAAAPEPEPSAEDAPEAKAPESPSGSMLSNEANASVATAFENLTNVMLSDNARTLDDLVREMLKPMLKTWLDQNLPPLVERLVRDEIERVSRAKR